MSDDRWLEIDDDIQAAVRHFEMAVTLYEQGGLDTASLEGYKSRMAFMHSMQSAYTCLENSLRRILVLVGEDLPMGEGWHVDLVRRCARATTRRPAVVDAGLAAVIDETRRFRHIATRTYDSFVAGSASPAVEAAKAITRTFPLAIEQFKQQIDPDGSAADLQAT